jgi:hypothetical protein
MSSRSWSIAGGLLSIFLMGAASCGSGEPLGTSGGGGSGGGSAGTGGGAGSGGSPIREPGCPATPDSSGTCKPGLTCAYRAPDASPACVTELECNTDGHWVASLPAVGCGEHPAACPATYGALPMGAACPASTGTGTCDYPEGRCGCEDCTTGEGVFTTTWSCRAWSAGGDGCPSIQALAGTACGTPGQYCFYGGGCGGVGVGDNLWCKDGFWQPAPSQLGTCARLCTPPAASP